MKNAVTLCLFFLSLFAFAQNTQTIRGKVIDQQSETPLPGVNVITTSGQGTTTDFDGYYALTNVPVGRISLNFSFIGYAPVTLSNLELSASKELIINTALRESTEQLQEVTVTATDKARTNNELVSVSGRSFSVEETQRFAGSVQDVSRMASNFAGVQRSNDAQNDIVIRGNSPIGLIWRLEGIDIPNPNHFGGFGATGGPVSMLNNNVLANSDFLTAAFPSNYGDGISGVFDLKLRNGNYEKHEFLGQVGWNGFEAGAEGPISRENKSSYLINYRYSTLGVISALGVEFGTGTAVPYYQDINMKLNFPSRKIGNIQIFALGGISSIDFLESENEEGEDGGFYGDNNRDLRNRVNTGVIGASHQYFYGKNTYSKVILSATATENIVTIDTLNFDRTLISPRYGQNFTQSNVQAHAFVNHKFSPRHVLRGGAFVTRKLYNLQDSVYRKSFNRFVDITNQDDADMLYQPYANYQYRPTANWEFNFGLHSMILASNQNYSIEPRLGGKYQIDAKKSINFGYGYHSQIPNAPILYNQITLNNGNVLKLNEDLDFTRSQHFVIGYDQMMKYRLHFKTEAYYQYITNAIVETKPTSFSSLNAGGFNTNAPDSVKNGGLGYNYGLDLTLEKFMDKGFYFLTTLSLYESQYQGSDNIWRNTAFNGNYVYNLLGGKEFVLSKKESKRRNTLTVDAKITTAGGQRYTPIDLASSIAADEERYDNSEAFSAQFDPYFRADIRVGFKMSGKKLTQEFALDIQNVSNNQNPFRQSYNSDTQEVETTYQLGLFPMVLYRVTF